MTEDKSGIAGPKQDEDLKTNPGIGQSEGAYAAEDAEGDNTIEGDVENDPEPDGSIDTDRLGCTNR